VLPGLHKQGIAVRFAYEGAKAHLSRGYKYSYSFAVVDNSLQIITKMGGEIAATTEYAGEGFKFKATLLKTDLQKFVDSYEKFTKKQAARL
jgi:murein tripeptide amidase MpaA